MKKMLTGLMFLMFTLNLSSQTFTIEIRGDYVQEDSVKVRLVRISKDSSEEKIIFNGAVGGRFNTYIDIPYQKGDAISLFFWLNQKGRGGIQLYPDTLRKRNRRKQFLSVRIGNYFNYNFKTVRVAPDY